MILYCISFFPVFTTPSTTVPTTTVPTTTVLTTTVPTTPVPKTTVPTTTVLTTIVPTTPVPTTPVPTTTVPTTTTQENLCEHVLSLGYNILDDPSRNSEYGSANLCDNSDTHTSPDWKGSGWYKISGSAGSQLPEQPIDPFHCGSYQPGWLNGNHPTDIGEGVDSEVCFNYAGSTCSHRVGISIIKCLNSDGDEYYLYFLKNTPACNLRYCTE